MKERPPWLKVRVSAGGAITDTGTLLKDLEVNTVCQEARCPNLGQCFSRRSAAFMILGSVCTRNCGFCAVSKGCPAPPDPQEPQRVAEASARLGLAHVVVTSVTRDDLPDGGLGQFGAVIQALKEKQIPVVEILTPDFAGVEDAPRLVAQAGPEIFNHNLETVPRLYGQVRPQADYARSLALLRAVKDANPAIYTKSGIMLGLGESEAEVIQLLMDLRSTGCDILTMGQYLAPGSEYLPVKEYVTPEQFEHLGRIARELGFLSVASAPLVRSSWNSAELFAPLVDKTSAHLGNW